MTQGSQIKPQEPEERREFVLEKTKRIIPYLQRGLSITSASRAAGIHPNTFFNWQKRAKQEEEPYNEAFIKIHEAMHKTEAMLADVVMEEAKTNWKAALAFLERRFRKDWSTRSEMKVEHDGKLEHNVSVNAKIEAMSTEQRLARLKELRKELDDRERAEQEARRDGSSPTMGTDSK